MLQKATGGLWFELVTNSEYFDNCGNIKVSKEDISGLIAALQRYLDTGNLTEG